MLVRSPLLTSHEGRELVSCGRLVCMPCFPEVLFVLFRSRLYAFTEAAALRSIDMEAPRQLHLRVSSLFPYVSLEMSLFTSGFCTIGVFSLCILLVGST